MSKPLRVLFVARSTTAHKLAGGMEQSYEDIANSLHDAGHEIGLMTTRGVGSKDELPPYTIVKQFSGGSAGRYSPAWWLSTFLHSKSWGEWTPDIVFSVSSAAGSMVLRSSLRTKIVAQCHGTAMAEMRSSLSTRGLRELLKLPLNALRIFREVFAYRRFTKTIAIGPAVSHQLTSFPIRVPSKRVVLINNGIDEQLWKFSAKSRTTIRTDLGISEDAFVGIFVARLHPQKGADIAIRSLQQLPKEVLGHLIVCGDGPQRALLESLVSDLGLSQRVHFLGRLTQEQSAAAMSAADVLVFPTRRQEGLPLSVLEALAGGLRLITVDNANVPAEFLQHAKIVAGSPTAVAGAWSDWSNSSEPYERTSKLSARFTKQGSVESYLKCLESLAADNPRRPSDARTPASY